MTYRIRNWHKFQHFKDRRPPWVKLYRDLLDDPDWHDLDGDAAKSLVMLWLIASEDDGKLPDVRKLAFRLRIKVSQVQQLLNTLSHWLDQDDIEAVSDRYQVDAPETETETETETQEKTETDIRAVAPATRPRSDVFEEFWKVYPKRQGANPKAPAAKQFDAAVKSGADPAAIIEGARRCAVADRDKIGTPYIPQSVKWLRDRRWEDYQPPPIAGPPPSVAPHGAPSDEELRKRYGNSAISAKTETACGANGLRPDHAEELPRASAEIRPSLRPM